MHDLIRRQTLADLLHRSAARHADKLAIVCGQTRWTYAEFDSLCDRLAAGLSERGVGKGDRVAVLARNSHGFAALRFALARLGAVLVPINFMLKPEEAAYILRHAGARVLATDSGLADLARAAAALDTAVREFAWLPSEEPSEPVAGMIAFDALATSVARVPAVELGAGDLAQIVYTSGTESLPKGAMLTHDAVIWQYVSCVVNASIDTNDLALHSLPLYHCAQLDVFLGPSIYVGATNVITAKPQPDNLLPLMERHGITSFFAPPTVWISMLRSPLFDRTDLSRLAKGYYGASIMPVEVLREIASRLPNVKLWNLYGQTEVAPLATMLPPEDQLRKPGSARARGLERGNARGRRRHARRGAGRHRRDRASHAASHARVLQATRSGRPRHSRAGGSTGRPRDDRRRGLHHGRRPQEGHDQDRWRERRESRSRGSDLPAATSVRGRRDRRRRIRAGWRR